MKKLLHPVELTNVQQDQLPSAFRLSVLFLSKHKRHFNIYAFNFPMLTKFYFWISLK